MVFTSKRVQALATEIYELAKTQGQITGQNFIEVKLKMLIQEERERILMKASPFVFHHIPFLVRLRLSLNMLFNPNKFLSNYTNTILYHFVQWVKDENE